MNVRYIPILKTTDAELRGIRELEDTVLASTLPLFELTKSRKTKLEPFGNVEKSMLKIHDVMKDKAFILDLTAHEDMSNYQIEHLQDETEGFKNWRDFLESHSYFNIFPVVHVVPDEIIETTRLVKWLSSRYKKYVLRINSHDVDSSLYIKAVLDGCPDPEKLILIIDVGFVLEGNYLEQLNQSTARCMEAIRDYEVKNIAVCSSSFPKSVKGHTAECGDSRGKFPRFEAKLVSETSEAVDCKLIYSDFASIHPKRYKVDGGTWIPRVDSPIDDLYIYTRFRREAGGYVRAAKAMLDEPLYGGDLECWGNDEIQAAASEEPNGLSPSYWIAVRLNLHITREVLRLGL